MGWTGWSHSGSRQHTAVSYSVFNVWSSNRHSIVWALEADGGPLVQCPFWQLLECSPGWLSAKGEPAFPQCSRMLGTPPAPYASEFQHLLLGHRLLPGPSCLQLCSNFWWASQEIAFHFLWNWKRFMPIPDASSLPKPKSPDLPCADSTRRSCLDTFRNDLELCFNTSRWHGFSPAHSHSQHISFTTRWLLFFFFSFFSLFLTFLIWTSPSFPILSKLIRQS